VSDCVRKLRVAAARLTGVERVDLAEAFDSFDEQWAPRLVAEPNDQTVKLARIEGAFVWHSHPDSDELFLVRDGTVTVERRGRTDVTLHDGQLFVVSAGVEHRPVADGEAKILLFEAGDVVNTGDADSDRTSETVPLE